MKLCKLMLNNVQVIDEYGHVRMCPWLKDGGIIGNLLEASLEEVYHGEKANHYRQMLAEHDFSNCNIDQCPYLSNDAVEEEEVNEIPRFPVRLSMAFEHICNYKCTCCLLPHGYPGKTASDFETEFGKNYDKIEKEIKKAMPYVKYMGSNGLAELFCSERELRILGSWEPLAPKDECVVQLETNGSMFNEKNWKKVENLKEFYVRVLITVMSFDEKIYQELSGTKLSISQIEQNLEYAAELRRRNIINHFQINTVYQERNFRTIPELVKRALTYGVDYIRLRPYDDIGEDREEFMWFKDVRNQYHPYHKEFLEVWSDPIFKNEKVHDWGGGKSSQMGKWPAAKDHVKVSVMNDLLTGRQVLDAIYETMAATGTREVIIYGCGAVGKLLSQVLTDNQVNVKCFIDQYTLAQNYQGLPIYRLGNVEEERALCIVSLVGRNDELYYRLAEKLRSCGYQNIMAISETVKD